MKSNATIAFAALAIAATACSEPAGINEAGWVRAVVVAVNQTQYAGSGSFKDGRGNDVPSAFLVQSNADELDQSLFIVRRGTSGRPLVGSYEFGIMEPNGEGALTGLTAFYRRTIDGRREKYLTVNGELLVHKSSASRVEGVFTFTGVMYCAYSIDDFVTETPYVASCEDWRSIDLTGPRISVHGTFAVVAQSDLEIANLPVLTFTGERSGVPVPH